MTLQIVTVLNVDDDEFYNADDVYKMQYQCRKHIRTPFEFLCMSNIKLSKCDYEPLVNKWPKSWSKLEIFRLDVPDEGILYIDLDMRICRDITHAAEWSPGNGFACLLGNKTSLMKIDMDLGELYKGFVADRDIPGGFNAYIKDRVKHKSYFCENFTNLVGGRGERYACITDFGGFTR